MTMNGIQSSTTPPKVTFFSVQRFERDFMQENHIPSTTTTTYTTTLIETRLTPETVDLATGATIISIFVNDIVNKPVLEKLHILGIKLIALRCAGYNNVSLSDAKRLGIKVVRVPAYSPYSVAEFSIALALTLRRSTHKAYARTREFNFQLGGLVGSDIHKKTVGIIGTGRIGVLTARIYCGFQCNILAYDPYPSEEVKKMGGEYVGLERLLELSDIVSLHCPLLKSTRHIIDMDAVKKMKKGVTLINTSRGGLIDNEAVIYGLKKRIIGALGIDVFQGEDQYFFQDKSGCIMENDDLAKLVTFPNVCVTGHMSFLTVEALHNIFGTTFQNVERFIDGHELEHLVLPPKEIDVKA